MRQACQFVIIKSTEQKTENGKINKFKWKECQKQFLKYFQQRKETFGIRRGPNGHQVSEWVKWLETRLLFHFGYGFGLTNGRATTSLKTNHLIRPRRARVYFCKLRSGIL